MNSLKGLFLRRVERRLIGLAMAALAFALEKAVLRAVAQETKTPPRLPLHR